MTIPITPAMQAARHILHDRSPWVWLLGIQVPTTPATRFRFTDHVTPITFDTTTTGVPLVWSPFSFKVGEWNFASDGSLKSLPITASNVTREVGAVFEAYDMIGAEVEVRRVWTGSLTDASAYMSYEGQIMSARVSRQNATIVVGARDLMRVQCPSARYSKHRCGSHVQFGGTLCGYVIPASPGETVGTGFSTCGKSQADCGERGDDEEARSLTRLHPMMFGGFPGLPRP